MRCSQTICRTFPAARPRQAGCGWLIVIIGWLCLSPALAAPPASMLSSQPFGNRDPLPSFTRLPQPARPAPNRLPPIDPEPDASTPPAVEAESLEQIWAIALAVDHQLSANETEVHAAQSSLQAAEAERWPLATLQGRYLLRDNEPAFRTDSPLLPFAFETPYLQTSEFSFAGRVSMPIYSGGTLTSKIEASAAELSARNSQLQIYRQQLRMRVAEEYVAVLRAEYGVFVAQSHASSLAAHARDIQMLFHCERVPKNDLLAAQVALSNSEYQVIRAENVLDAARASLNRRLGRPLAAPIKLSSPNVNVPEHQLEGLTSQALSTRPELSHLDAQIAVLQRRAAAIAGTNRAQVELQGAYAFQENEFQSPEGITSAGIGVTWRPYDAGRVKHQVDANTQRARAMAHRRDDLESLIQLEVRKAWGNMQESRRRVLVMRDAVGRAEENLRVTRQRYQNGMSTNTDVLNAEALRVEAHHNHNHAGLDAVLMTLELQRAIGAM